MLGPTDSGKSTLSRFLAGELARQQTTAIVDCDPGQAIVGPPTTLGFAPAPDGKPLALRFVGSTTPTGHFLQTLTGMKRLAERASAEGFRKLVFDSCGYIDSDAGCEFHFQAIDLLDPDHLVALQSEAEMERLLAVLARRARPRLHRVSISRAVVPRTAAERRRYREERFATYFQGAVLQTFSLDAIGLHGHVPDLRDPEDARARLIALCDSAGFASALGIVLDLDTTRNQILVFGPAVKSDEVASVQFGSIRIDRSGREL